MGFAMDFMFGAAFGICGSIGFVAAISIIRNALRDLDRRKPERTEEPQVRVKMRMGE